MSGTSSKARRRSATTPPSSPDADDLKAVAPSRRPFAALGAEPLASRFAQALSESDGPAGAHCIHELWMRGEFAATIEKAQEKLWACAAATIPEWLPMRYVSWLPVAYEVCGKFEAAASGRSHLYLVLLDFTDRRGDPHGLYVGMSRYTAAQRFDQHKAGIRSAGSVLKRGIEVLTGPVLHLQYIRRAEAARLEGELAEALRDAGLQVEGGH